MAADIFNIEAVDKIYQVKGRLEQKPLVAFCSSIKCIEEIAVDIPDYFYVLAKKFLPGPLTIVLKKSQSIPDRITSGFNTIAVRIPNNEYVLSLLKSCENQLATTSANISGSPSLTDSIEVINLLDEKIPLIIDGGKCRYSCESTIVDLSKGQPLILREGVIIVDEIEEAINQKVLKL